MIDIVSRLHAALTVAVVLIFAISAPPPTAAQTVAAVGVDAASDVATIPAAAWGLNAAVWDGNLLDTAVPDLLSKAGVAALRYPGGSTADLYNWQTNSIVPGQGSYANPNNNFDAFMNLVKKIGATPILTVNYGSNPSGSGGGDPNYAASWVQYANVAKGYGVKYWEIGNEVYGNGFYGSAWETDLHAAKDPTTYGKNVAQFAAAMKAVDPTIKVGAVLTASGNWPDGQTPDWNANVLAQCGSVIDFVIVHWYPQNPGNESDAGLLAAPQNAATGVAAMASKLKSQIAQYGGANAPHIQFLVTETNSVAYNPGKQTLSNVNALFVVDDLATWIENGATSVDVWALHNGAVNGNASASLYGATTYGDYGVLSSGSGEPAANTPFPTYYGLQMASLLGKAGDTLVAASSSNTLLTAHAVRQANGSLALLLINKDPANTVTANVSLSGFGPTGAATVYSYTPALPNIASSAVNGEGSNFSIAVPPYSMTTIVLTGTAVAPTGSFTLSAAPTSLSIAKGASAATTVSVAPSGGFTGNVAFSTTGLPAGVSATFSPAASASTTTLLLAASSAASTGTGVFTITGAGGGASASTAVALTITGGGATGSGPASFSGKLSASSPWWSEETVTLSTTAPITALTLKITIPETDVSYGGSYNTLGGQIVNSYSSAPLVYTYALGAGQTINPGSLAFVAQLQGSGVPHNLTGDTWTITYTSGGVSYTQSGAFGGAAPPPPPPPPPGFALSASPTNLSIVQGASSATTIAVAPAGGFGGGVNFAASGLPTGVTATFSPPSAATATTLTLTASASTTVGSSAVIVTGTSGALNATTSIALTITPKVTNGGAGSATFASKVAASSPWWDENDVVLTTTAPITALTLKITIANADVSFGGSYNTVGGQVLNSNTGAPLVYTYVLSPGQTIDPGSFTFAAQMRGAGVTHNVSGDSWTVTYTSGGGAQAQSGKF